MHVSSCLSNHACMCASMHVYACVCECVRACVCVRACMCVCVLVDVSRLACYFCPTTANSNTWHHTTCMHRSSNIYESLDISWHCTSSSVPQFSSSSLTPLPQQTPTTDSRHQYIYINNRQGPPMSSSSSKVTTTQRHDDAHKPFKITNINFQSIKTKHPSWQLHLRIRPRHSHRRMQEHGSTTL